MERAFKIGCRVVFFDSLRQQHDAIVTNWFHGGPDGQTIEELQAARDARGVTSPLSMPCSNIVWVSSDVNKTDPYGRQVERATSVSHGKSQGLVPFLGMSWCWPDEEEEARALALKAL